MRRWTRARSAPNQGPKVACWAASSSWPGVASGELGAGEVGVFESEPAGFALGARVSRASRCPFCRKSSFAPTALPRSVTGPSQAPDTAAAPEGQPNSPTPTLGSRVSRNNLDSPLSNVSHATEDESVGDCPSSVDSLPVRIRPRWKDVAHAEGVPTRSSVVTWSRWPGRARLRSRRSRRTSGSPSRACTAGSASPTSRTASAPGVDRRRESAELRELTKRNRLLEQENEVLRRAAAYLSPGRQPKMMYPLVLDLAADRIPVTVTCRVLGFSTPGVLQVAQSSPVSAPGLGRRASRSTPRCDIHHDDPAFGYRFIADELPEHGHHRRREPGRPAVLRAADLVGALARKRGLNRRPGPPVHDDLVEPGVHAPQRRTAVAHRHHRAPHRRGQALPLLREGRLVARPAGRDRGPFGPRQSISL